MQIGGSEPRIVDIDVGGCQAQDAERAGSIVHHKEGAWGNEGAVYNHV